MQVDKAEMGRMAVQVLINRVQYPESGLVRVVMSSRLLERDSVRTFQHELLDKLDYGIIV